MNINFDNLVEDIRKAWGKPLIKYLPNCLIFTEKEIKALILTYIERDRSQGQEPVAEVRHEVHSYGKLVGLGYLIDFMTLPEGTKLFTHAQPTPEQIADAERWNCFCCNQTALMLGSKLDPNDDSIDWKYECDGLADKLIKGKS